MNTSFHFVSRQVLGLLKDSLATSWRDHQKKIALVTLVAASCFAAYYVFKHYEWITTSLKERFKGKPPEPLKEEEGHIVEEDIEELGKKKASEEIKPATPCKPATPSKPAELVRQLTPGKLKSVEAYKRSSRTCSKIHKGMIFKDIKRIKSQLRDHYELTSVESLLLYLSELKEIDLHNEVCAQAIVDTFKEGDKETSEQLVQWLKTEKTFHVDLLSRCLSVFIEKEQEGLPFNVYALELLVKIYQEKGWNQAKNEENQVILPVNHSFMASAMAILIKKEPNNDRIGSIAEWMMNQPEYDLITLSQWILIFQQKSRDNYEVASTLYYPLLNKIIAHAQGRWTERELETIELSMGLTIFPKK